MSQQDLYNAQMNANAYNQMWHGSLQQPWRGTHSHNIYDPDHSHMIYEASSNNYLLKPTDEQLDKFPALKEAFEHFLVTAKLCGVEL